MNKKKSLFDWLDYKNEDEVEWATNYLNKKGLIDNYGFPQNENLEDVLFNTIDSIRKWHNQDKAINLHKLMKAAKDQRRNRHLKNKDNQKNYSFVMDKSIQGKLKNIAGEQPLSQTLEHIINDVAQFKKQLEAQLRESIKPSTVRVPSLVTQNSDAEKIKKLNILKKCQEAVFEEVLKDLCKYEHIFEKMHYTPFIVTDDYKAIESKFQKRKTIINKQIKDKLGFFRSNLKASQIDIFGDVTAKTDDEKNNDSVNQSV
ncbi:hypothetical protein [Agitococcus lubricus]|uniref:Uncharacterized protein n=1 Tax=Agitococcus lubricus TaxID=1077255 RepID=A0A2T5IU21_9GAMM|nr:hypothetical protein [Agitococcus lubricus]PTQ87372.1 hypothetical protein C8N29_11919 [Agitococcus lubricus]